MVKQCSKCFKMLRTTEVAAQYNYTEACTEFDEMKANCTEEEFNAEGFTFCACNDCVDAEGRCKSESTSPYIYADYFAKMQSICSGVEIEEEAGETGYGFAYGYASPR